MTKEEAMYQMVRMDKCVSLDKDTMRLTHFVAYDAEVTPCFSETESVVGVEEVWGSQSTKEYGMFFSSKEAFETICPNKTAVKYSLYRSRTLFCIC
jgi:hypothetical protein